MIFCCPIFRPISARRLVVCTWWDFDDGVCRHAWPKVELFSYRPAREVHLERSAAKERMSLRLTAWRQASCKAALLNPPPPFQPMYVDVIDLSCLASRLFIRRLAYLSACSRREVLPSCSVFRPMLCGMVRYALAWAGRRSGAG